MAFRDEIRRALKVGEKLTGPAANEANTKALVIEPVLAALGWDTGDPDQVVREWRVYNNTSLDYALIVDDKPGLYLEAKAIKKKLDDRQFIAQAVNYANNDGVEWCVLTNGSTWRVYKANESVVMDQKLLFEVDLADVASGSSNDPAKAFQLLARDSIISNSLDDWGERVFTDTRVRQALGALARDQPHAFVDAIIKAMGKPEVPADRLRASIARVFDAQVGAIGQDGKARPSAPDALPGKGASDNREEYPLSHHLASKPAAVVDLFERLDEYGRSLGADVTRRIRKQYVGYFRNKKSFFTLKTRRQRVVAYISIDPTTIRDLWNAETMRDVTNKGHLGIGNTEYSIRSADQIDEVCGLISLAYTGLA